jgi:hypothetical protein
MSIKRFLYKPWLWLGLGAVLLLVAGGIWCYQMKRDPERVFWGMINQSLTTSGVTVDVNQNRGEASAHQMAQYSFGAANISRSITTVSQPGTTVKNESLGTQKADYTRYLAITTDQKGASGKSLDFSKVVGIWGKSEGGSTPQLFPQAALGIGLPLGGLAVPVGNLDPDARRELIDQMRQDELYKITFSKVKKERREGRLYYSYTATIKPVDYAGMMIRFAKAVGLRTLDDVQTANFVNQPEFELKLTVDVRSRHLVAAETDGGTVKQAYSAYDVPVGATAPEKTVSFTDLQERLFKVQQQ